MRSEDAIALYQHNIPEQLYEAAMAETWKHHGKTILLRGLIEYSNHCRCTCQYCGIRAGTGSVRRYRLGKEEMLRAVDEGYKRGLRTFVLQGGEDPWFTTDRLCRIVEAIKERTGGEAAVTLSCGVRNKESYRHLREAGADRYLLRFETADEELHALFKEGLPLSSRLNALRDLRELGYEVGSGFMVGLPGETEKTRLDNALLAQDLALDMVGIGPFIPHPGTPLADARQETIHLSVRATALLRLLLPLAHIPATTAAGSLHPEGREMMLQAGANVLMPNITPARYKKNYLLYPGKICLEESGIQCIGCLGMRVATIGRELSFAKGGALRLTRRR